MPYIKIFTFKKFTYFIQCRYYAALTNVRRSVSRNHVLKCANIHVPATTHTRFKNRNIFSFLLPKFLADELRHVRESESRYKQQYAEAQRREKLLVRRLAAKEQEMHDYAVRFVFLSSHYADFIIYLL